MRLGTLAPLLAALALAACGDEESSSPDYKLQTPPSYRGAYPLTSTDDGDPRATAGDAERLRPVLEGWAEAVRRGDFAEASSYFGLPAIVRRTQTGGPVELRDPQIVRAFNGSFPCGAKLVDADPDGRYVVGTFVLVPAEGRKCDAPGDQVKVGFVFGDAKHPRQFTEWWEVDDVPEATAGPPERPEAPAAVPGAFSSDP